MTRDSWRKKGSKSARRRAKEEAKKLLEKTSVNPIDEVLAKELDKIAKSTLK